MSVHQVDRDQHYLCSVKRDSFGLKGASTTNFLLAKYTVMSLAEAEYSAMDARKIIPAFRNKKEEGNGKMMKLTLGVLLGFVISR